MGLHEWPRSFMWFALVLLWGGIWPAFFSSHRAWFKSKDLKDPWGPNKEMSVPPGLPRRLEHCICPEEGVHLSYSHKRDLRASCGPGWHPEMSAWRMLTEETPVGELVGCTPPCKVFSVWGQQNYKSLLTLVSMSISVTVCWAPTYVLGIYMLFICVTF